MAEGKHAEYLKGLGFVKIGNADPSATDFPHFSATGGFTFVTDEVGQRYMAMGIHDLSALDLENTSATVRALNEASGGKKPS